MAGRPGPGTVNGQAPSDIYYRETWGFDPARVRRGVPPGKDPTGAYWLEDGFPLDAPGDELLDALDVTLWARVEVAPDGTPRNHLVFKRGVGAPGGPRVEAIVHCVHLAVYAAPLEELVGLPARQQAELARSTENARVPVALAPLEHFAALRSFAAGLADLGIKHVLAMDARSLGFNDLLVKQLGNALETLCLPLARDPATPPATLARLAQDEDHEVRAAVARNARCPPKWREFARRTTGGREAREALAINPACPAAILALLAKDAEWSVRRAVARNPRTPGAPLAVLAWSDDPFVRHAVGEHPHTPVATLRQLAGDDDLDARAAVARNPRTPVALLEELAANPETLPELAGSLAGNPSTPPALIRRLVASGLETARRGAVRNPNTPPEVLAGLARRNE